MNITSGDFSKLRYVHYEKGRDVIFERIFHYLFSITLPFQGGIQRRM
jgi:hypothetical protein